MFSAPAGLLSKAATLDDARHEALAAKRWLLVNVRLISSARAFFSYYFIMRLLRLPRPAVVVVAVVVARCGWVCWFFLARRHPACPLLLGGEP